MRVPHSSAHRAPYPALLALVLCAAGAAAQEPAAGEGWPEWLEEAMAKESTELPSSKISMGEGGFESVLAGKALGGAQTMEGGWYLSSDIGGDSPFECWVLSETADSAALAANIADIGMQAGEQANGKLGEKSIYFVDAGAYNNVPFLALEWFYLMGEAPNARVGLAKVRVAMVHEMSVACGHNMVGYRDTFARAFEKFVRGARVPGGASRNYYEEVIVQRIGDQPIGVSQLSFALDEEGDTRVLMVESSLVPVDASTLSTSDTWSTGYSRPDGTLINQVVAQSSNGELTMQLSLDPLESGDWLVSGSYQGKEINQEIGGEVEPLSEIGQMRAVRDLLADEEQTEVALDVWVPQADPTRFLPATVVLDPERKGEGEAKLTIGPLAMAARFDASGSLLSGSMQAGAAEVRVERVWAHGTPP